MHHNRFRSTRGRLRAAAVVLVTALALTTAACSSATNGPGSGGASGGTEGGTGAGGGTLTVSLPAPPQSLSPGSDGNGGQNIVQWLTYEPLIWMNPDGSASPGLATSWKYVGNDNKKFELEIRTSAKFADGTPVTAESVANTINFYLKNPGPLSHYLTGVTEASAAGSTVTITLSQPNPILPRVFSQANNWGDVISPAGLAAPKELTQKTFGAGAYVLDTSATVAGDHYTFTKNANYWNPSAQKFDKVVVKVIGDPNAALQALVSGQVQVVVGGAPSLVDQAKKSGAEAVPGNAGSIGLFLLDRAGVTSPALGKTQARQAMNYAIDREAIAKAVGPEFTPSYQIVGKGGDGYDPSIDSVYKYDPAKAKELLAQAGYPDGFSFKLVDVSLNSADTVTQAVVQQLAAVGIKAELTSDNTDLNKFIADMASKKFGAATFGTGGIMFANALQNFAAAASPLNPFNSKDPTITAAFDKLASASPAEQPAAAVELNKAVSEQAWFVPVVETSNYTFAKGVKNIGAMGPQGELSIFDWTR